jgi:hypothetical protein
MRGKDLSVNQVALLSPILIQELDLKAIELEIFRQSSF